MNTHPIITKARIASSDFTRIGRLLIALFSILAAMGLLLPQTVVAEETASVLKTNATSPSRIAAEKLAAAFPSLYWYASDACLRETTRHGFGHPQKYDEFVKTDKALIDKFDESESKGTTRCTVRLRLLDPATPDEYWILDCAWDGKIWEAKAGCKYLEGKLTFDLFKEETFAGIRVMGSMKPYIQKVLTAYSQGKDVSKLFPPSPAKSDK